MTAVQFRQPGAELPPAEQPTDQLLGRLLTTLIASLDEGALDTLAETLATRLADHRAATGSALLTPAQAAALLSVHPKTLTRAAAAGRVMGAVRVGRAWRFAAAELSLAPPRPVMPLRASPPVPRRPRAGHGAAASIRGQRSGPSGPSNNVRVTQR